MKTLILKAGRDKSLKRHHPWIFSGAIERVDGDPKPGATIELVAASGEFLAYGAYSPTSQIRVPASKLQILAWIWERGLQAATATG